MVFRQADGGNMKSWAFCNTKLSTCYTVHLYSLFITLTTACPMPYVYCYMLFLSKPKIVLSSDIVQYLENVYNLSNQ